MLTATQLVVRGTLFEMPLWPLARVGRRSMSDPTTRELAPTIARDVIRAFAVAAIGVNVALSLIDVWRIAYYVPAPPGALHAAALAVTFAIPLHLRHVLAGLRGERPRAGGWTLAALAIVNAIAYHFVGNVWVFQFASLAVSILIVVPGVWAVLLAGAVMLSPLFLVGAQWYWGTPPVLGGIYLMFAITWRAATQFVPLRLIAAIRALDAASGELEVRAVVQARVRIDAELRTSVARALETIVARGESARAIAGVDPSRTLSELRRLTGESRTALAETRRLVARYRGSSSRAEVNAVLREWERQA